MRRGLPFVIGSLSLLACSGVLDPDSPVHPGDDEAILFEVPKGTPPGALGDEMVDMGFLSSEYEWKIFLKMNDGSCLKAGKFELRRSMSLNEVLATLCGPPMADDVPFTVLEGWRIRDTDAALAEAGLIEAGAYAAVAMGKTVPAPFEVVSETYEGYLWPETYMVPAAGVDPGVFVTRQLETFQREFLSKHSDFGDRTLNEIVIMGSLLEREEPKPEQRPLVSGILWNRIDKGWQLGVDATSRYTIEKWNDRKAFMKQLRDPDDPYNTRIHKGLPPTAIGAPTLASLEAAMNPEKTPFMFYLHDHDKNLHPARNAAEHEANRKRFDVY